MRLTPSFASGKERRLLNTTLQVFVIKDFLTDEQIAQHEGPLLCSFINSNDN